MSDEGAAKEASGGSSSEKLKREFFEGRAVQTMLSAAMAWLVTVAPAAFARGGTIGAKAAAVAAIAAALGGPGMDANGHRLGRHLGITAFAALSVLTWLLASQAIHPTRLDPIRGLIGTIAWGVFAISWSERWSKPEPQPVDPEAPGLLARTRLPPLAVPVAALGVAFALVVLALAWRVRDVERALVAQTLGSGAAIWILGGAATVAIARGKKRSTSGRRASSLAIRRVLLLATIAIAGAIVIALR